jgi:hypothetical protein
MLGRAFGISLGRGFCYPNDEPYDSIPHCGEDRQNNDEHNKFRGNPSG